MGRSTESDVCKNVLQLGNKDEIVVAMEEFSENYVFDGKHKPFPFIRGWEISETHERIGQRDRLYGLKLTKGDCKVFVINSSEYSSVGEHWYEITSDNRDFVVEFRNDFEDLVADRTIAALDSICQTG